MEEDYPADQLTVEQLRANAFASASANLALLAVNSQKAAITDLSQQVAGLEAFVQQVDAAASSVPLARTLLVALAITIANAHRSPSFEEARSTFTTGADLLQKLAAYNPETATKSTYDILQIYFPDSNSDTPQVYPDFTPEKVENSLGNVAILLFNWLDATFSLLQNKFDE